MSTNRSAYRTLLLMGHGGTGKTALGEALLELEGGERGRHGVLDHEVEERERGHSLSLAVASLPWRERVLTIVDTPGGAEALGDAFAALAAADLAVFVVDASVGVQAQHDELWAACDELAIPRLLWLNKFDLPQAAYQRNIEALRERYGKALAPVHMPIGVGDDFTGVIDLLRFVAVERRDGQRVEVDVPDERREQAERNRELLVEAIVENDDALLERYLEGETPGTEELAATFATGIAGCGFFPLLCGSVATPIGVRWLADFVVDEGPAPEMSGPATARVIKTHTDRYVGRVNLVRVASGELTAETTLQVARTGATVRLNHPARPKGAEQEPMKRAPAGAIVRYNKLEDVRTGDLLHPAGEPVDVVEVRAPRPQHRTAIVPAAPGSEDRLAMALSRLADEDAALEVEHDPDTGQTVLSTYGPEHFAVSQARLARKFGIDITEEPLRIAYRETLRATARAVGKHVKQSGGHGQYGIAEIEVSPLPRGEGFRFSNEIVGGVIPRQYIPSVEKGIVEAMARGVLAGYPVVDVAMRLLDGKHHSVDSSDMAFQAAGSLAFRAAAEKAGLALLEPIMHVEVTVPGDLVGDVMGNLSARRGRIQGSEQIPGPGPALDRTRVHGFVPQAELTTYVPELRSLTRGTARVDIVHDHYDFVPEHLGAGIAAREGAAIG
ncbi:elongation factor G [Egibacter rhizosphaerae]|uniref:Elongation factor G n=1 Tax=Egibacter rhizosphaerae TaxID=1670831 RepID=A0A411YEY4_9ACTN|nr:elongation factor G [Egibacter rhizosphaerae]QBI19759.1 elongation factor G [Egibacter rhizosphaerae]